MFGLNGVKSCNFRQYKHGNGTFMKARDSVYDGIRDNPFNVEVIRIFFFLNIYTMYNTGERNKPEERLTQPLTPSPTHQISTQDPTSYKSHEGADPPPS